jgi:hypothetical protein
MSGATRWYYVADTASAVPLLKRLPQAMASSQDGLKPRGMPVCWALVPGSGLCRVVVGDDVGRLELSITQSHPGLQGCIGVGSIPAICGDWPQHPASF